MILQHFNLKEQPFGVTPDTRYLYASKTHREALASLMYGVQSGLGFIVLSAQPGMGKTTLLFEALSRMSAHARTVFLFQTISTPEELMRALLLDLGVKDISESLVGMQTRLNEELVAQSAVGKPLVVAIDEAQGLPESVLEAVRMLSNFETARHKLMQIILSGQVQLADTLNLPQLLQLRQRISIFAQLTPLDDQETGEYIQHRLRIAGLPPDDSIFTKSAVSLIARQSGGIPRNINNLCFNALSLGCALQKKQIDADMIQNVLQDLQPAYRPVPQKHLPPPTETREQERKHLPQDVSTKSRVPLWASMAFVCGLLLLNTWLLLSHHSHSGEGDAIHASTLPPPNTPPAAAERATPEQTALPSRKLPLHKERSVQVRKGQSLYGICIATFGKCPPEKLKKIIETNPSIPDPDHIESGQRVVIPL